jgi:type I restriction enzyme M protein
MAQRITQQQLESYLWGAAVLLRGTIDAGDYKQFIFPLLFYKRLCDVFDEETQTALAESDGDKQFSLFPENHRFQIPPEAHWHEVRQVAKDVGRALQSALRAIEIANPDKLYGIFGDAQWTNKDRLSDAMLRDLVEHFSTLELTIANLPEDELGLGYEYLIKKFADDSGHTAAEFYTNRTVVHLMTEMLQPQPGESVYDPTCGSGGMLLSAIAHLRQQGQEWRNLRLYGQERNLMTSAIARMNCFLHGIEDFRIERGDSLSEPKLVQGDRLMRFDVVLANPPYSIKQWDRDAFASDPWGRNLYGAPPQGRADYAFWQHILQSLTPKTGRSAILFPHGVLFRQEEANMRRKLIEADVIECVLGLGPNLFYNSAMEACVVICRTAKAKERRNTILFINAVNEVTRERTQSFLTDDHIACIVKAYDTFKDETGFAKLVSLEEVRANDYSLKIDLYVPTPTALDSVKSQINGDLSAALAEWAESRVQMRDVLSSRLADTKLHRVTESQPNLQAAAEFLCRFDRSKWTQVRFGDVVRMLKEQVNPRSGEVERYIAGEHMESDDVHIRRWGTVGDGYLGPAFIRRFRKGQVLYGSRRTYLKKVAMPEFDGVTANTTFVLEAVPGKLLQELLPWLMLSERFTQHSIRESKGSTNPYINFPDIAKFEFALPPIDQQHRIAEILWAVDEVEQNTFMMLEALESAKAATVDEFVSAACNAGQTIPLLDGCHRVTDGTHQPPKFTDEGIPFFLVKTISSGRVDWGHTKFVSQKTYGELTKRVRPKRGDILYTAVGATYGVALLVDFDDPFVFQHHIAHIIPNASVLDSGYLLLFLNSPYGRRQSDKAAIGSAQPTVTLTSLSQFQVPCPALEQQKDLVVRARGFDAAKECTGKSLEALRAVRANILNEVLP